MKSRAVSDNPLYGLEVMLADFIKHHAVFYDEFKALLKEHADTQQALLQLQQQQQVIDQRIQYIYDELRKFLPQYQQHHQHTARAVDERRQLDTKLDQMPDKSMVNEIARDVKDIKSKQS